MTDWTAFLTGWSIHILSVLIPWAPVVYITVTGALRGDLKRCYGGVAACYLTLAVFYLIGL